MSSPWTAAPADTRATLRVAHDRVVGERVESPGIRLLVEESWRRSLAHEIDPDKAVARLPLGDSDLRDYREQHPLRHALPTLHKLLIRHTFDAGLIIAIGDEAGRLLWIDGDRELRRRAEGMLFVEGADWSESVVGTSAPGTALQLDHGIQISGPEHFTRLVHPWSCTAVPVHDPASGAVLGVIDITGGDEAVAPATLPLMEAAVAAVEAELRLQRLDDAVAPRRRSSSPTSTRPATPELHVLGRDDGELAWGVDRHELSLRHAEMLTLLAWHRGGLTAERLAELLYGRDDALVTLRAEMVRLRKVLPARFAPLSKPYRLPEPVALDAQRLLGFLERGAHKVALGAYRGPLLPRSTAPGIVEIRTELAAVLRETLMSDAAVDTLLDYARTDDAAWDVEVWQQVLRMLPARSPKRAGVVTRIERIQAELG